MYHPDDAVCKAFVMFYISKRKPFRRGQITFKRLVFQVRLFVSRRIPKIILVHLTSGNTFILHPVFIALTDLRHGEVTPVGIEIPLAFPLSVSRGKNYSNMLLRFNFNDRGGFISTGIKGMKKIAVLLMYRVWKASILPFPASSLFIIKPNPVDTLFIQQT